MASYVKIPVLPSLVIHENELGQEKNPISPFLEERRVPAILINEENPRVTPSPKPRHIYREMEERSKNRGTSPMRYSYNVDQIKTLGP